MGSAAVNQNVSETSIVSFSLSKLLIFFMTLDVAWIVFGNQWLGPMLSFLFHLLVLQGVKHQRTSVLLIYVVLNVIVLSFAAVGVLFFIGALMTADSYIDTSSSAELRADSSPTTNVRMFARSLFSTNSTSSADSSSSASASTYPVSSEDSYEVQNDFLLVGSILLLVSVIILYCKIYSVVLAARLRRLLLTTPVLPVHVTLPVDGVHDQSDDNDDKPLLEQTQMYDDAGMGYPGIPVQPQLYYPNIQGAPSMMPPPFMYGQHPVFYTFAPAPPTNEKQ